MELEKLAYAASLPPFVAAGVKEYSREEVFKILREAPDPYERFKEIAKAANAGVIKLPQPWESLRVLIMLRPSEERRLMKSKAYRELDKGKKKTLFYATLALEEAFGVYRSASGEYAEVRGKAVQNREVGEEPFKKVVYMADLSLLTQLAEKEEVAFENALRILREGLNEYAVKYGLRDFLDVNEDVARRLAEAEHQELSEFGGVSFGVRAYAALIAYREYTLGRRGAFGAAVWYWLEVGGLAWLLYYAPITAYVRAKRAGVKRSVTVEEMVAEALRRLFLKPGADHHRDFVELLGNGRLALMLEDKTKSSYVFRLFRLEEGDKLKELEGVGLRISMVGEGIVYALEFEDVERWPGFFKQVLETAMKAAEEVKERLPVEDRLLYVLGWVDSDLAISGKGDARLLQMSTSYLWQLAETKALFDWSDVTVRGVSLTLEGPKPQFYARTSLKKLDEAIKRSAEGGWLKMLDVEAGSWDGLKLWVSDHWGEVIDAVKKRLEGVEAGSGFDLAEALRELEGLKSRLDNDKTARKVIAPALLLIQAERLGVNETTLKYFGAAVSGAVDGDGYVSSKRREVGLTSNEREIALLWGAALAAYGIEVEVRRTGGAFHVVASGDNAVKLAGLYFLYGSPLLEEDEKVINRKLTEAVELGAEGLDIRWEGLRRTEKGRVAADLTLSEAGIAVKYNVYLRENAIELKFASSDRRRVELATRLLKLAGVGSEVKKEGGRDEWYVRAYTDMLATGREEFRRALAEIVRMAVESGWVEAGKAEGWLEKLVRGRVLMEGWPKYLVRLVEGALEVSFSSTNPSNIERETQRLKKMGLVEGVHFSVKMPEEGRYGYVRILREGLERAAWLLVHGSGEQQRLAAEFIEYVLQRSKEAGDDVYEKAKKIMEEGKARGSLTLKGFEKEVEVDGRKHVVKVIDGDAEFDKGRDGKKLLRIKITAEVDGVKSEYVITYGRYGAINKAMGFAVARAAAPGGREADAERCAAVVKALTGVKPKVRRMKDGKIIIECSRKHLDGFKRYAELAGAMTRWLEETGR